ncbi:MAG: hypothetical protein V4858_17285 [Pseudomonadota bacterium]
MIPYILIGSAIACAGAFWYGTNVGEAQCQAKQKTVEAIAREVKESAQQGAAAAIAANRPRNTTIVNEVQREVQTNTVYSDCRNTPDGVRSINEALTGKRPDPAGGGKLPGAVPAK